MNKVLALVVCLCVGAMATPINLSGSNGEQTLQEILDSLTVGPVQGVSHYNCITDQVVHDEIWTSAASGGGVATFAIELAGNANTNSFGIYDLASTASLEIFSGPQTGGDQANLTFFDNGRITVSNSTIGLYDEATFLSDNFGFYIETANNGKFYSQVSKNSDDADHVVVFQGNNIDELQIAPYKAGICGFNEYIFAWEDLPINGADGDYNDMIVLVESIRPVPEPATLSFLGIGLLSLFSRGLIRRKRT